MMIKNIEKIDRNEWQQLLADSQTSTFFQTPACYDFFESLSFMQTFGYGAFDNNRLKGLVTGYIVSEGRGIKSHFSRRAIIHGGLLLAKDCSTEALEELLQYMVSQLRKQVIYIEIRNYRNYSDYKHIFEKIGFLYSEHLNFHVDTPNQATVFSQLNITKRRHVRVSIKNGANIVENPTNKQIREYFDILSELYSTKIKLPLFPFEFFEKLHKTSFGKFFLLSHCDKIIGGSVCAEFQNEILFEMFVCGLDRKYKNIYPSTLATWSAIEYAASNNIKYFDMMGAGKPDDEYGVREFKSKFGGRLVEYGRFKYICSPTIYKIAEYGLKYYKKCTFKHCCWWRKCCKNKGFIKNKKNTSC